MKKLVLFFAIVSCGLLTAQTPATNPRIERLDKIYRNLEYNTTAFNDLKNTWIITDPVFVREIYNRFIVKNALRIKGVKPSMEVLELKSKDIYSGNVFIDLRRRYYDNEIELLRFFTEARLEKTDSSDYFFDPLTDFVYIQEVLGTELYNDLKKQFYSLNDITKEYYDTKSGFNFDIYLHFQRPELMFWSITTENRNKYLVSLMGRWGNDHISMPGWFHPEYVAGLKVDYVDYLLNNRKNSTYTGEIGIGIPAKQPQIGLENDNVGRKLFHTGTSFYLHFAGQPLGYLWEPLKDVEVKFTGLFTLNQLKSSDFGINYLTKFYSTRNYIDLFFKQKEILNFEDIGAMYAGIGIAAYDIRYYALNPDKTKLEDLQQNQSGYFKQCIVTEAGFEGEGGLLSHNISTQMMYNVANNYGYLGFKLYLMLTNTVGFDFKFFTSFRFTQKGLPFYRDDNYVVFSPVIRINY